jgi:hypothetical protein
VGADPVLAGQPVLEFDKAGVGVGDDLAADPAVGQAYSLSSDDPDISGL